MLVILLLPQSLELISLSEAPVGLVVPSVSRCQMMRLTFGGRVEAAQAEGAVPWWRVEEKHLLSRRLSD